MTAEDRQLVKDTLAAALALPVKERPGFIAAATAGAPHVRREVSLLVSLSEDAGEFLETPAIGIPANADPLPGDLIGGRYQLEEPLGHGGSASVFKARDTLLGGKPVAMKILRHGVFDDAALRNEIAALARIDHPGIASVTDAGTLLSGRLYLVTRYIAGPTLAERLDQSKFSPKQAGRLARRLAAALAAAHEAGVLHLDLRPANIILERAGTPEESPVILDFGIAKRAGESYPFAALGATPYHAPELAQGSRTAAADVYALGVLLREMIEPPVPHAWRRLIAALTDPNPDHRPPTASIPARIPRPSVAPAFAAAAFAAGALFWAFHQSTPPPAVSLSVPHPVTAIPGEEETPAFCGDTLYFTWQPPASGEPNIWKILPGQHDPVRVTVTNGTESVLDCSPDGTRLAFLRDTGHVKNALVIHPVAGGAERVVSEDFHHSLTWSPGGRAVTVSVPRGPGETYALAELDLDSGRWTELTQPPPGARDTHPAYSPDGRQLAFVRQENNAGARLLLRNGDTTRPAGTPMLDIISPVWISPNHIVFAGGSPSDRRLWTLSTAPGAVPVALDSAGTGIDAVAYHAASRRLVLTRTRADENIARITLSADGSRVTEPQQTIVDTSRADEEPAISPDGRYLAFASSRSGDQQVWLTTGAGENPVQLTQLPPNTDLAPFWSPDSEWIGFGFRTAAGVETRLIRRDDPSRERILPGAGRGILWSADGKSIYHFKSLDLAVEGPLSRYSLADGLSTVLTPHTRGRLYHPPGVETLYFAPFRELTGIWRLPAGGGALAPEVYGSITRRAFVAGPRGLYFVRPTGQRFSLFFQPYGGGTAKPIHEFPRRVGYGMSITADGRHIYFTERAAEFADLHAATVEFPAQ